MRAEAFFARFIVGKNISDDCAGFRRSYPDHLWLLTCGKLRADRKAAARQTRVGRGKIDKARLSVAEKETGSVVVEATWKIEPPFCQLEKRLAGAKSLQGVNGRHVERTGERFAHSDGSEVVMTEILRIVVRKVVANCVRRIRQERRRRQHASIERGEIHERLQRRTAATRLHCAVHLRNVVILRSNECAHRAGGVFDHDDCSLRDIVAVQRLEVSTDQLFSRCLQGGIERRAERSSLLWLSRYNGVDKMRSAMWRHGSLDDWRIRGEQVALLCRDRAQLIQSSEGSQEPALGCVRVTPWV